MCSSTWGLSSLPVKLAEKTGMSVEQAKISLLLTSLGTTGYLMWKEMNKKNYRLPPGPKPFPIIGNMNYFAKDPAIFKTLHQLGKEYGPIFSMRLKLGSSKRDILVGSYDLAKAALLKDGNNYTSKPKFRFLEILTDAGKDIIGASEYDSRVQIQRKLAFSALRNYASGEVLEDHLSHVFSVMCKEIKRTGPKFSAKEVTYLMSYNMLASMCFGTKFDIDDPWLKDRMVIQKEFEQSFNDITSALMADMPILKYLPLKILEVTRRFRDSFHTILSTNYEKHLSGFDAKNPKDFTDFIINATIEAEDDPNERSKMKLLERDHFKMILFDLFFAGTETTRQTLWWIFTYMAAFPEVQKKAHDEIDSVLGKDGRVTTSSRENLPYVDAIIHEVLRLRPLSAMQIRKAVNDTTLGGYDIPKGTDVWFLTYSMHYSDEKWKDPEAFLPERWMTEGGKYLFQESGFVPFSMGKRSCIGESFAKLEIHMLTTMVLQKFELQPLPGYQMSVQLPRIFTVQPMEQEYIARER